MKIQGEHMRELRTRTAPFLQHYRQLVADYAQNSKIKSPETAARWRIYHAARMYDVYSYQQWDYLDAHVDTAMRAIVAGIIK